ncbi:MAG: hypothetical protein E7513_06670 [Ruminococcaceae bacterium]|nr:hypothetical protein [Oscillospiraceae bacterium]
MKKFKVILSVIMVLIIICVSVVTGFATVVEYKTKVIVDDELAVIVNESKEEDKIPVVVWYKDVSQTKIDAQVKENTGLTVDTLSEKMSMPDASLLNDIKSNEETAEKRMYDYLEKTKSIRDKERENTEIFVQERRKLSRQAYTEKSEQILVTARISDSDIIFSSKYAPMIICDIKVSQIKELEKDTRIESISYYKEQLSEDCSFDCVSSTIRHDEIVTIFGLTGDGVKIGMVESGVPGQDEELNDGSVINVGTGLSETSHATGTAKIIKGTNNGFAKNAELYSTNGSFENIEQLITSGVRVINCSYGWKVFEDEYSSRYAYSDKDKWFDHIVSFHNITVVVSAGNAGSNAGSYHTWNDGSQSLQRRINSPGMANNVITVGAYKDGYSYDDLSDDRLNESSSYKNHNGTDITHGVEKPDVVMPSNSMIDNGGTSYAAPILTAMIAQILELKPSLAAYPQAIKAIVLASCHRKVQSSLNGEEQETMEEGITERQGAGAPDAWTMACIVCQGTYGTGEFITRVANVNFIQPPYGAENMNVSVTWVRENTVSGTHSTATDITAGNAENVNLSVRRGNPTLATSNLEHSSTEMCYVPLSDTDFLYQIRLVQEESIPTRYGYAWSTDNMRATPMSEDGIYYIRNANNGRYLTYDTASTSPQIKSTLIYDQNSYTDAHRWIIKHNGSGNNLITGYGTQKLYLGQSTTTSGTSLQTQLDAVAHLLDIVYNDDGTVSFINSSNDRILSCDNASIIWNSYDGTAEPLATQRWRLEKNNYLVGDVNMDGAFYGDGVEIVNEDAQMLQLYLVEQITLNNVQTYLADATRDGVLSIFDATKIIYLTSNPTMY